MKSVACSRLNHDCNGKWRYYSHEQQQYIHGDCTCDCGHDFKPVEVGEPVLAFYIKDGTATTEKHQ